MVELQLSPPIGCHSKWDGEGDDVKKRNEESQRGSVHFRSPARDYMRPEILEREGIRLVYFDYAGYAEYRQLYPPFVPFVSFVRSSGPSL
jgi:hypothetical protein